MAALPGDRPAGRDLAAPEAPDVAVPEPPVQHTLIVPVPPSQPPPAHLVERSHSSRSRTMQTFLSSGGPPHAASPREGSTSSKRSAAQVTAQDPSPQSDGATAGPAAPSQANKRLPTVGLVGSASRGYRNEWDKRPNPKSETHRGQKAAPGRPPAEQLELQRSRSEDLKRETAARRAHNLPRLSLEDVLDDAELATGLVQFARRERSDESVLFILDARRFEESPPDKRIAKVRSQLVCRGVGSIALARSARRAPQFVRSLPAVY
jgi:hypothetical protein